MIAKPNFFLLGAPKCGTSALRHYLSVHPEIFFAVPDEPGFFDRRFRYVDECSCAYRDLDDYLKIYAGVRPEHRAIGEGSVYMMYSANVLTEILDLAPEARFLIMLRNPYLASISMHGENLKSASLGREPQADFSDAWWDLPNRDVRSISGVHPMRFRYDVLFSYDAHVRNAIRLVPSNNLKVLIYDDFKADNVEMLRLIFEFLNVDYDFVPDVVTANERSQARDNLAARFVAWGAMQSRKYRFLRRFRGRGLTLNRFTQKKLPAPKISEAVMNDMRRVFEPDINRLERTLGRELDAWLATDLIHRA